MQPAHVKARNTPGRLALRYLQSLITFVPLLVFITYALWDGPPPEDRWLAAYKIASPLAIVQLAWAMRSVAPINRLLVGANVYLLAGGFCAWFGYEPGLRLLGELKGAGVLLSILLVGATLTLTSRAGFVGATRGEPRRIKRNSAWLLVATMIAFAAAYQFSAAPKYGTAIPLVAVVLVNRLLRENAEKTCPKNQR